MGIADELERLQSLRERGALSPEEFERAKARVLGAGGPAPQSGPAGGGADASEPIGDTRAGPGKSFFRQLARSRTDRLLGGVCGGLGRHTDLPSWAWRLIFCLITLYFGAGVVFYLLLWIFLPLESAADG